MTTLTLKLNPAMDISLEMLSLSIEISILEIWHGLYRGQLNRSRKFKPLAIDFGKIGNDKPEPYGKDEIKVDRSSNAKEDAKEIDWLARQDQGSKVSEDGKTVRHEGDRKVP
jgi:hypothetical protein